MSTPTPDDGDRPVVVAVNGAAVAALVLGIVGIATAFLPFVGILVGGLLGLAGLAAGIAARRRAADDTDPKRQNMGLATGGIVSSAIALFIVALQVVGIVTLTGLEVTEIDDYLDSLGSYVPGIEPTATDGGG